ncbi:MAG TPA: hypothetical protein VFC26_04690 [Verrucomicrobiae bacterium]|nr:hypothetical protein [Verrucomicrobiae bacterium]
MSGTTGTTMMVTDSFYYFVMLMAAGFVLWLARNQFGPEARSRRRRRKNHYRVVNMNKRPGITFLVRAR